MRRVVSVWFPHWCTDRLQRRRSAHPGNAAAFVTALHDGRKRVLAATDRTAAAQGLRPGMAVAQAMALVPELEVTEADPDADADALRRLALWCHALTPLAAPYPPDGLWLDMTGCVHARGEAALLQRLLTRLARDGLQARAAVADTPGAAHAFAHHGPEASTVVPPGMQDQILAPLPIACLRIPPELEASLRRLGFDLVGHLARIPRALLARRFGDLPGLRLDQLHGRVDEPIDAVPPEQPLQRRVTFVEPLLTAESFQGVIPHLVEPLCMEMERQSLGARQLDLLFERIDGHVAAIRVGTARPSRNAAHLVRMLIERLETIDPGLGVEAMRLVAPLAEPLQWEQQEEGGGPPVAQLIDRLVNRLGSNAVYRTAPVESDLPERMTKRAESTAFLDSGAEAALHVMTEPFLSDRASPDNSTPYVMVGPIPTLHAAPIGCGSRRVRPIGGEELDCRRKSGRDEGRTIESLVLRRAQRNHLRLIAQAPCSPKSARAGTSPQHGEKRDLLTQDPPRLPWLPRPNTSSGTGLAAAVPQSFKPWPNRLIAPARLFTPPRPVKALAALPDKPPIAFIWRRRHRIHHAEGPERIFGEWWQTEQEATAIRDYFIVEDEEGQRFWLFRRGNGIDPVSGDLEWFLHGLF